MKLSVDTACEMYEFRIIDAEQGIVEILESTDPRLRVGKVVRIEQSTLVGKKVVVMDRWVCKGYRLVILGPNGPVHTATVSDILIEGNNWSYSL